MPERSLNRPFWEPRSLLRFAITPVQPPRRPADHPDRRLDCEERLDEAVNHVAEAAIASGWTAAEVDLALLNVAIARLRAADANLDTDDAIRRANREVEGMTGRGATEPNR